MKPRTFAFVVGGAALVAFILALSSCGSPGDCTCENPYAQDAGPDWFDTYYGECVDMCEAAEAWGEECGWPAMREGCAEWLWWRGVEPMLCEGVEACYEALRGADDCSGGPFEEGWRPPTWSGGNCPVQVP